MYFAFGRVCVCVCVCVCVSGVGLFSFRLTTVIKVQPIAFGVSFLHSQILIDDLVL